MEPQRTRNGQPTLDPARQPHDEDFYDLERGAHTEPVTLDATDPDAEQLMGGKLPGRKAKPPKTANPTVRRRKLTQIALGLYTEGKSVNEIAAELGVSTATVTGWFTTHRRETSVESIDLMLDQIAVPLAADNLVHGLLAGDKQYTLETLKGRGRLRTKDAAPAPAELPTLRIEFAFPPTALQTDVSTIGMVHATPLAPKAIGAGSGVAADPAVPATTAELVGVGTPVRPRTEPPNA